MLQIRCLGQLSVLRDGQPVAGAASQPRRLAILALLARAGDRGVSREKIIAFLWPDSDEERARRLVSQAVYMLRRDLGSDDAITGVRDLRLNPDVVSSDVQEFQEALDHRDYERAASAYAGPFLDGFHLPGAPEFERWADEERTTLAHDGDTALEKCAAAAEARGDYASAVSWWRRRAATDPINARVAIRLMRALAAAGDRNGAIRHAAIHQALVEEQLEIPADIEVIRLADQLRSEAHAAVEQQGADARKAGADAPDLKTPPPARAGMAGLTAPPASVSSAVASPAAGGEERAPDHASPGSTPSAAPPVQPQGPAPRATPQAAVSSRRVFGAKRSIALGASLLLAATAFFILRRPASDRTAVIVPSRVVVAPLENRTGMPELEPVGRMVAEWVTQGLLRTGLVEVVDPQTMLATASVGEPAGAADYLRTLAERTRAGTVVAGSYFVEGDRIRFLVRITNAPSGELRHSVDVVDAPVARPTAALEPLRERITGALAVLLDPRLNNWSARASQPPTYEAYAEFLLGMETFGSDYPNSARHFARAAELDSSYWQAKLWAGMTYANIRNYPPADSLFRLLDRNRARLAPYDEANLDYFHGGFVRGDWETSYRGARRMLTLAPGAAHAVYAVGLTAQITNRLQEAVEVLPQIDTRHGWGQAWAPRIYNLLARSYHQLGDYDNNLRWARELRASEPNAGWARLQEVQAVAAQGKGPDALQLAIQGASFPATADTWEDYSPGDFLRQSGNELRAHGHEALGREALDRARRWYAGRPRDEQSARGYRQGLARVLLDLQLWNDARELFASLAAEDSSSSVVRGALGVANARLGRMAEADSIAARLVADARPWTFGAPRVWAAHIAAVKGDRQGAVALLHQAVREGYGRLYSLHAEPDFEPMRDYPAFRDLLRPRPSSP